MSHLVRGPNVHAHHDVGHLDEPGRMRDRQEHIRIHAVAEAGIPRTCHREVGHNDHTIGCQEAKHHGTEGGRRGWQRGLHCTPSPYTSAGCSKATSTCFAPLGRGKRNTFHDDEHSKAQYWYCFRCLQTCQQTGQGNPLDKHSSDMHKTTKKSPVKLYCYRTDRLIVQNCIVACLDHASGG